MIDCPHTSSDEPCTVCTRFNDFVEAVAEMRENQNEYFSTTSHGALSAAKRSERRVDMLLRRIEDKQGEMF